MAKKVSIRRPVRGLTSCTATKLPPMGRFNPQARAGPDDPPQHSARCAHHSFNPQARAGPDKRCLIGVDVALNVSIRRPVRGLTAQVSTDIRSR